MPLLLKGRDTRGAAAPPHVRHCSRRNMEVLIVSDSSCVGLLIVRWILSRITDWSPMVGTPINQVRRPINQGLIKFCSRSTVQSTILHATITNNQQSCLSKLHKGRNERWLLVGVVAQWQSTGTESQRPWVRFPAAPPFFPALSPFQRSTDSNGKIRSLIRPWLIGL